MVCKKITVYCLSPYTQVLLFYANLRSFLDELPDDFKFICFTVGGCPSGWVNHGTKCYHFSHDQENWPDAMVSDFQVVSNYITLILIGIQRLEPLKKIFHMFYNLYFPCHYNKK